MKIPRNFINTVGSIRTELDYWSHKPRRVLFDHLPKCAGTTITQFLMTHYPNRYIFDTNRSANVESVKYFKGLPENTRFRYRLISGHLSHQLMDYVHPDTIASTVFREPIDRIISHYYYVKRTKQHYLHDWVMRDQVELRDYCYSPPTIELRNWYTTHYSGLEVEEAERLGPEAVQHAFSIIKEKYRLVGFQDDLPSFMNRLTDMVCLSKPFKNIKRNKTKGRSGVEELSDVTREYIGNINFLDVQLYAMLKEQLGYQAKVTRSR